MNDAWLRAMRGGDFEAAWRVTDALESSRAEGANLETHLLWDGTDPNGRRVAVRSLHGLGDALQFSRFLPALAERAAELTVAVPPALVRLFAMQEQFGRVVNGWREFLFPPGTVEIEIMELAYVFRATEAALPPPVLIAPERPPDALARVLQGERTRVALVPASSGWGGKSPIPWSDFRPVMERTRFRFFHFQPASGDQPGVRSLSRWTADLSELAAALTAMDLVVTVDGMIAHLAGSLRRPVWLLLDAGCDWRWQEGRADSPWYPTMRIFRRGREGWDAVLSRVGEALDAIP
jgi:ADP-heptose:LPS heptosyltransferase